MPRIEYRSMIMIQKRPRLLLAMLLLLSTANGCIHPKIGLQKKGILDPMMDPAKTSGLYNAMNGEPQQYVERGSGGVGGSVGGSCPTCGG